MKQSDVYIYDAVRTPRGKGRAPKDGKPGGSLSEVAPHDLVAGLVDALRARNQGFEAHTNRLTLGCVGQIASQGGHLALVSRLAASLPDHVAAQTLNNYCVSGLTAINNSYSSALTDSFSSRSQNLYLAGGVESLSQIGFLADQASYYTDPTLIRKLRWAPPIMGAELLATLEGFTKEDLDELTLLSHQRAASAWQHGAFAKSVVPVTDANGATLLSTDELIRSDLTAGVLAEMPPAFAAQGEMGFDAMMLAQWPDLDSISHVHSFANCPGMADGAALVLLGNQEAGRSAVLTPKARIVAVADVSDDPILQFGAGFKAMEQVLADAKLSINDFDRIEFMEAFAATPLKFMRDYKPDIEKLNVNGGHLAMGHPMGATGAILVTQLVHELERSDGQFGLVVASAGGGLGSAMIIERI